jgi:hypothetical protein
VLHSSSLLVTLHFLLHLKRGLVQILNFILILFTPYAARMKLVGEIRVEIEINIVIAV